MDLGNLPAIDFEEALRLAGNDEGLARDMRAMLIKNITEERVKIKMFYQAQNYEELFKIVHKLHGGACYCGVPRMKAVLAQIEVDMKANRVEGLEELIEQVGEELVLLSRS